MEYIFQRKDLFSLQSLAKDTTVPSSAGFQRNVGTPAVQVARIGEVKMGLEEEKRDNESLVGMLQEYNVSLKGIGAKLEEKQLKADFVQKERYRIEQEENLLRVKKNLLLESTGGVINECSAERQKGPNFTDRFSSSKRPKLAVLAMEITRNRQD